MVLQIWGIVIFAITGIVFLSLFFYYEDDDCLFRFDCSEPEHTKKECLFSIFMEISFLVVSGLFILLGLPWIALVTAIILIGFSGICSIYFGTRRKEAKEKSLEKKEKSLKEFETKYKAISVIYRICVIILLAVVAFISVLLWKDRYKTNFNAKTLDSFPEDVLKNGYYYVSRNLKLTRVEDSVSQTDEAGKIVLESGTVKNEVIISKKNKRKTVRNK